MSQPPPAPSHPGEPSAPGHQPSGPGQEWDAAPPPPGYGTSPYGPPAYGPPGYGPPQQYGPPPWPHLAPARPARDRTGLLWGLVAALATLSLVLGVLLAVGGGPDPQPVSSRPVPEPAPAATLAPTGLGDDPALDRLAQQCADGQMNPCDDLYDESFPGSGYEAFADTCAGRRTAGEDTYCADVFYDA